jgi:hypothetical protein
VARQVVAAALGSLVLVGLAQVAAAHPDGDDMHELPVAMGLQRGGTTPATGVTIYLNRHGGRLTGGWDDSASDVSSVALNVGEVTVPKWRGGDRRWKQVTACVRERFGDFDIDVVTERPRGDYMMVMVGGTPDILGYPDSVGGVAPYTGEVLRTAVGYVFAEGFGHDVENTCVSILHEAGHMLGLDHEYLCEDPMSYLWGCGEKRFQDADAYCGEGDARSCGSGETTQNSYRRLAALVGLRDGGAPEVEEPEDDDPPFDRGEPVEDGVDVAAPAVKIDGGSDELAGNQWIEVVVRASDDSGIADVELGWASDSAQYVFACGAVPDDMPVACSRDGDTFRFQLYVGTGLRAMAARATDAVGNQTVSEARVLYLL